ncbi:MAG: cell surface protein, partial [Alistipes sp.]|nr:cell surface protein [Alistipes sp.]
DQLTDKENTEAKAVPNHFRISDAIDSKGKAVELKYIDFIKVQTGVNAQSGWLGELSTEVFSFYDCNMIE